MRVEVVLDSCSIRGILETSQARVSDHLNAGADTLSLKHARVVLPGGEPVASESTVYINTSVILFVVDLTPRPTGHAAFQIEREAREVTLNIGTIWVRGDAHLPVGGEMQAYFEGSATRFMPLTNATVIGREATAPRTVLINRDQLRCMMAQ
jgi:hypothetical protein